MPKPFPQEFRRDVVAVARKGETPISQIAKDFGVSESCLHRWLNLADIEDGVRPGVTAAESAENRELKKRVRVLEQENEILRRAARASGSCRTRAREPAEIPHAKGERRERSDLRNSGAHRPARRGHPLRRAGVPREWRHGLPPLPRSRPRRR